MLARSYDKLEQIKKNLKNPNKHKIQKLDLTDISEIKEGIDRAYDEFRYFDIVLHVAGGGLGLRNPLISSADFITLFNLNLISIIEINSIIAPRFIERKKGNLVHVCSIASMEATASVGYNTVKAALAAYVRSLGREMIKKGIRCN